MIFTQTLVPIDNIIHALTNVSAGQFNIKLEKISISEFETIRFHLSKVIQKLKANLLKKKKKTLIGLLQNLY